MTVAPLRAPAKARAVAVAFALALALTFTLTFTLPLDPQQTGGVTGGRGGWQPLGPQPPPGGGGFTGGGMIGGGGGGGRQPLGAQPAKAESATAISPAKAAAPAKIFIIPVRMGSDSCIDLRAGRCKRRAAQGVRQWAVWRLSRPRAPLACAIVGRPDQPMSVRLPA
ncbi:hypothetical protein D3C77_229450 [compost metagenome]